MSLLSFQIVFSQEQFPSYNTKPLPPDSVGMELTAQQIGQNIVMGWNLGNSLEVPRDETGWGNPEVSFELLKAVKSAGFNAIRIPCAWDSHLNRPTKAKINPMWLGRVNLLVDWCIKNNMYVIINIHWDGGWLENHCTKEYQKVNNEKQRAYWEQIATFFRDYDYHLLFAGCNEPNVKDAEEMEVLLSYEQTFIDAVRSTGGKNYYRTLIVQGPSTDISKTYELMTTLPKDVVQNRMMAEVHYYSPWNFCGLEHDESWGKMFYFWGRNNHSIINKNRNPTWGEEEYADSMFTLMKQQFCDKGIPVILGEYSALKRMGLSEEETILHNVSRAAFCEYVTRKSKQLGLIPFYWDNGNTNANGCAIFDRFSGKIIDGQILQAIKKGAWTAGNNMNFFMNQQNR